MGRPASARRGLAAVALALGATGAAGEDNSTTKPYVAPQVEGLHWVETFDGDVWSRWVASKQEKYIGGKFRVERRKTEALVGDVGFLVPEEAKHYGVSSTFAPIEGQKEVPFVVQFEAKFQDGLTCGGSYIKLFDSSNAEGGFRDDTPYVVMFGPDRCGGTDKVHFILRHKSPKTGLWEEKHSKEPPSLPRDELSHLYGLIINPDNSYEIQIDGVTKTSGNLLNTMSPPINPPKEIADPSDSKPSDWVDEAKIADPLASKPDDWDEDAPMMIFDESVSKPSGWVDDAERRIADPSAKRPEDWDDEEDGEWEPPMIDNPACKVGCGKWEPPKISNPAYKGKWHAPKIDNPEYKGVWSPRQIPNPDYFMDESPSLLPKIDSVGIDIWTMSKGIMFDNILISTSAEKAKAFADQSWRLRKELEDAQQPKSPTGGTLIWLMDTVQDNIAAVAVTAASVIIATIWCCCRGSSAPRAPTPAERRELLKQAKAKSKAKEEEKEAEGKEKAEEPAEESKEAEGAGEDKEEDEEKEEEEKPAEGGLGHLDDADES